MLRELRIDDAVKMNKWMHDVNITNCFDRDFSKYSVEDCKVFIKNNIYNYSLLKPGYLNFAITDSSDEYKGTISLKYINYDIKCAEFAIVLIGEAQGTGLAKIAFNEIMKYGFEKLGLDFIYFSCKKENIVANKFYSKTDSKLVEVSQLIKNLYRLEGYSNVDISSLCWYIVYK